MFSFTGFIRLQATFVNISASEIHNSAKLKPTTTGLLLQIHILAKIKKLEPIITEEIREPLDLSLIFHIVVS